MAAGLVGMEVGSRLLVLRLLFKLLMSSLFFAFSAKIRNPTVKKMPVNETERISSLIIRHRNPDSAAEQLLSPDSASLSDSLSTSELELLDAFPGL